MFYNFITKYTDIFCWKIREAFALQKLLTFFQQKILAYILDINVWNFNETLTNDVVSFEQPGPELKAKKNGKCFLHSREIVEYSKWPKEYLV